jgi:hypothetical protein
LQQYYSGGTFEVQVGDKAANILFHYADEIVDRRDRDLQQWDEFAARWGEQAWRLALVLHVGRHGDAAHNHPLAERTARDAVKIARWFAEHQLRLLQTQEDVVQLSQEEQVLDLVRKAGQVTPRDVQRKRITKTAEEAKDLLDRMCGQGNLVCVENNLATRRHIYRRAGNERAPTER